MHALHDEVDYQAFWICKEYNDGASHACVCVSQCGFIPSVVVVVGGSSFTSVTYPTGHCLCSFFAGFFTHHWSSHALADTSFLIRSPGWLYEKTLDSSPTGCFSRLRHSGSAYRWSTCEEAGGRRLSVDVAFNAYKHTKYQDFETCCFCLQTPWLWGCDLLRPTLEDAVSR